MASRLELHEELCNLLGSRNVYFQPPASVEMQYPCIVYNLSGIDILKANNSFYKHDNRYDITVIDYDPDSKIVSDLIKHFRLIRFDRSFISDNLNHWVLTLYY